MSISASEEPVALGPEKHSTKSSCVPPFAIPPSDWSVDMGACRVPLNAETTLLVTAEMLLVVPSACTSRNTADPWKPLAQPTVVAHVGVLLVAPVVGFRLTAPGFLPTAAWAVPAPITKAPRVAPATPSSIVVRPTFRPRRGFGIFQFIGIPFMEG